MRTKIYHIVILSLIIFSGRSFAQSYTQDFSTGLLPAGADGATSYGLSVSNQQLIVNVNKATPWDGFRVGSFAGIDLSNMANRTLSFDIKTDTTINHLEYNIFVQLFDNGNQYATSFKKTILATGNYRRVSFSFAAVSVGGMNWSTITGFQVVIQPASTYNGTLYFDSFALGTAATNLPYFEGIPTQYSSINSGTSIIKIRQPLSANIYNQQVTFSAVSSNTSLIPSFNFVNNPTLSSTMIPFTDPNGGTSTIYDGRTVLMSYTPAANQSGMATVTVTATTTNTISGVTLTASTQIFTIVVKKNIAPTIADYPASLIIGSDVATLIKLGHISSGNTDVAQLMTITGTSDNQAVIQNSNIVVSFTGTGFFANVSIKPQMFSSLPIKTCNINLTIKDDGGTVAGGSDQTVIVIPVTVYPTIYNSPSFDPLPDQNKLISSGPQIITITGIKDGNGGSNITSLTAVSSNPAVMSNPVINYFKGDNYATLVYNIYNVGAVTVSVIGTNTGAPANSNGNASYVRTFGVSGILPPINGYTEDFSSPSASVITAEAYGSRNLWRDNNPPSKWYSETNGKQLTTTVNTISGTVNVAVNKFGLTYGAWFAGLWYKPDPINTFNFASFPYLSVKLSATFSSGDSRFNPSLPIAIDLWDVNDNRYGLSSYSLVNPSENTYTFCYNGKPSSAAFDFTKVKMILFNFPALGNSSEFSNLNYAGNVTIRDIRLGDQAMGSGSCPGNIPVVRMDTLFARNYLTTDAGSKSITITGIDAGISPVFGLNNSPVTLAVNASGAISSLNISPINNGVSVLSFNTLGSVGTTSVTVSGSASGSTSNSFVFQIKETLPTPALQVVINNDVNALHPDGFKGQTMDGFGATLQSNVGGGDSPLGYQSVDQTAVLGVTDQGMTMARMAIPPNFETMNDNNDPNVINFAAFDENSLSADLYLAYQAAGVQKFIASCWSTPSWTKLNKATTGNFADNTIDTAYVQEIAEFFTAYVLALKQKTGIEIYAIDLDNEPQFNEPYTQSQINPQQFIMIMNAMVNMFNTHGIKTLIFGPETLGQDNNGYIGAIAADPVGRNNLSAHARHNYANNGVTAGSLAWAPILAASRNSNLNGGMTRFLNNPLTPSASTGNGSVGIPVWQTETSGYPSNWIGAFNYGSAMQSGINYGNVGTWTYWNYVSSSLSDYFGQITPQGPIQVYYAQKHFSKYVQPGAVRVPAAILTTTGVFVSAFQNRASSKYGASLVTVLTNSNSGIVSVSLSGVSLPSAFRVFQSYEGSYWKELATTTGVVNLQPNSITTLWGNGTSFIAATSVSVTGFGGSTTITTPGGTLALNAAVLPANVPDNNVVWYVSSVTGNATIDKNGILRALSNGTVSVLATSVNTPSVSNILIITISGQGVKLNIPVLGFSISGNGGLSSINSPGGVLPILANFNPISPSNSNVTWSVAPANTLATISPGFMAGYLKALNKGDGIVTVTGVSADGGISSSYVVTIAGQSILMQSFSLYDPSGNNTIKIRDASLILGISIFPANTSNDQRGISFSVITAAGSGLAGVDGNGTVKAIADGLVTIVGISLNNPTITSSIVLTISGQKSFTYIKISALNVINLPGGSATLSGVFLPSDAVDDIVYSLYAPSDLGTITGQLSNVVGELTSIDNGNGVVSVVGISALNPSIVSDPIEITISNQTSAMIEARVSDGYGGDTYPNVILNAQDRPVIYARFDPFEEAFVRNNYVIWTADPIGIVDIGTDGLITPIGNGTTTITGTYSRNPLIYNTAIVTVSDPTLSINSNLIDNLIKIYPNPAKGVVNIEIGTESGSSGVNVYNTMGALVLSKKIDAAKSSLDLSGFPDGLYNFVIATFKGVSTKQVVVIH